MRVGVARVPSSFGHLDPAPQPDDHIDRLRANRYLQTLWVILLAALRGDHVATGRKLKHEGISRERGVHFDDLGTPEGRFPVRHRGSPRRISNREIPAPVT